MFTLKERGIIQIFAWTNQPKKELVLEMKKKLKATFATTNIHRVDRSYFINKDNIYQLDPNKCIWHF